jgi:hypothetical protein
VPSRDDWHAPDAIPSLVPEHWPSDSSRHPPFSQPSRCPEIDCVRHLLPAHLVSKAEARAIATGVGADNVLITWGVLSEETYVAALSTHLGLEFEPLFSTPRRQCPLSDDELIHAATTGMLHLQDRDGSRFVVAPRLVDSRRLVAAATSGNELARSIRLTSTARLRNFVARHSAVAIEHRAAEALRDEHPELSAGVRHFRRLRLFGFIVLALIGPSCGFLVSSPNACCEDGRVHRPMNGCRPIRWSSRSIARRPRSPGWSLPSARSTIRVLTLPAGAPTPQGAFFADEIIQFIGPRVKRADH